MNATQRAFTLIELLVVIAIIGILSAVILAGLNQAQTMARDRARLADMRALITALELAKDDSNLPSTGSTVFTIAGSSTHATLMPRISPYLSVIPAQTDALVAQQSWSFQHLYCNKTSAGDGTVCLHDDDPNTFAIRFRTEAAPLGGSTYHCATSRGVEAMPLAENGGSTSVCIQR